MQQFYNNLYILYIISELINQQPVYSSEKCISMIQSYKMSNTK